MPNPLFAYRCSVCTGDFPFIEIIKHLVQFKGILDHLSGAMQTPAKAILEASDGALSCVSFELVPDGAGTNVWVKEFCGPLTDLARYFLTPAQNEEWPLESTMPSLEQLFHEYIESYKEYI